MHNQTAPVILERHSVEWRSLDTPRETVYHFTVTGVKTMNDALATQVVQDMEKAGYRFRRCTLIPMFSQAVVCYTLYHAQNRKVNHD